METIILGKYLDRGLPAIQSRCPHKLRQCHHGVRRKLMNLNFKGPQHFNDKSMLRQAKSRSKKCLKNNQLPLWLRDLFDARSAP
jgi:hypothetical protein